MNKILLFLFILSLISCKNWKQQNYIYYINNNIGFSDRIKFISYKNYLFEFVAKISHTQEITIGYSTSSKSIVELDCIYIMKKNNNELYQINSFSDTSTLQVIPINKKKGIKLTELDSVTLNNFKNFHQFKGRDSIINNLKYKVVDSSYVINDTMQLNDKMFYLKGKKVNTIFNIKSYDAEKTIKPYIYCGVTTFYKEQIAINFFLTNFKKLSNDEINICEAIIKKVKNQH